MSEVDKPKVVKASPASLRNTWMFSLGAIGHDMAYYLFAGWLMSYIMFTKELTDVQFATVGIIIVVCRVYDAVITPFLGGLIDNTRSRFGKFKPWIFTGMVLSAIVLIAVFTVPLSGWSFVLFIIAAYLVFSTTFSMNDIAYWGMMPSLSSNPHERNLVVTLAGICSAVGIGLLSLAAPTLTAGEYALGGNAVQAYGMLAVIIVLCFVGFSTFTLAGVKETRERNTETAGEKLTLKMMVQTVWQNDQLLWACLVLLLVTVGSGVYTTLITMYVYLTYGYDGMLLSALNLLGIFGFPLTMFMPAILKRVSRKSMTTVAVFMIIAGVVLVAISCLALPRVPFGAGFWLLGTGGLLIGLGGAMFNMMVSISIANTVEYNEWKTGERRDSLIYSLRPFVSQLASGATQLVQVVLFLILGLNLINGRIAALEQETNRSLISAETKNSLIGEMLNKVPNQTSVALLFCMLTCCVLFFAFAYRVYHKKYFLDEKRYDEIMEEIKKRKEEAEA